MYFQVSDAHHHHGGHTRTRRRVSGGSWDPHPKRVIATLQMRVVMSWGMQGQLGLTRHEVWIPTHYFFSIVLFLQSTHSRIWEYKKKCESHDACHHTWAEVKASIVAPEHCDDLLRLARRCRSKRLKLSREVAEVKVAKLDG